MGESKQRAETTPMPSRAEQAGAMGLGLWLSAQGNTPQTPSLPGPQGELPGCSRGHLTLVEDGMGRRRPTSIPFHNFWRNQ